jgi:hypothetical protein
LVCGAGVTGLVVDAAAGVFGARVGVGGVPAWATVPTAAFVGAFRDCFTAPSCVIDWSLAGCTGVGCTGVGCTSVLGGATGVGIVMLFGSLPIVI